VSTRPFIEFKASMQLLNDPWPGNTTLSLDLILFKFAVTSILTLSLAASLKEFITELMFADIGYEEAETKGLGWISGKVSKINNQSGKFKLPHIGWNEINIVKDRKIFKDIDNNSHMYFVHSYEFVPEEKDVISATTDYSSNIVCSVEKENIFGTQFHPEKSDKMGLKMIDNFINL